MSVSLVPAIVLTVVEERFIFFAAACQVENLCRQGCQCHLEVKEGIACCNLSSRV